MNFKRAIKILEVGPEVTPADLKTSFRRQALKSHPDRNPGDQKAEKKFRECLEAYNFLVEHIGNFSDITEIDSSLPASDKISNLDNVFDDIFGFSAEGRVLGFHSPQPVVLSLTEFALGVSKIVSLKVYESCLSCDGKGSRHKAIDRVCSYCFGMGSIRVNTGKIPYPKICAKCRGRGRVIENPCLACEGFGKKEISKMVMLEIPQGFWPGQSYTLMVKDKKKKSYEAFVHLHLAIRTFFQVEKDRLVCHYPISSFDLQGRLEFPTPWGWHVIDMTSFKEEKTISIPQAGLVLSPGVREKSPLIIFFRVLPERDVKNLKKEYLHEVTLNNPHYGYVKKDPWYKKFLSF